MDSAFALRERNATQSVSAHLTQAVSALPLTPASALDGMKRTRVALIAEITAAAERIIGLSQSSATAAAEAKEAAEKAQTWSMVGCIVALVVVIVIAIIVSVFTFGAAGPAGWPAGCAALLVQLLQVVSRVPATARPWLSEPVRMSC